MEGMGEMMKGMGTPPPKQLYPSLMSLPELSPEQRKQVEQQAAERMHAGTALMAQALDTLNAATQVRRLRRDAGGHDTPARRRGAARQRHRCSPRAGRGTCATGGRTRLVQARDEPRVSHPARRTTLVPRSHAISSLHDGTAHRVRAGDACHVLLQDASRGGALWAYRGRQGTAAAGSVTAACGRARTIRAGRCSASRKDSRPPTGSLRPPMASRRAPAPPAADRQSHARQPLSEATSAPPLTANWQGAASGGEHRHGNAKRENISPPAFVQRTLPPFHICAGQFLNLAFGIGGARMNRSYSISSSPTQREYVDLTVRREPRGAVSRHIVDLLKVGDQIEAGGPVGRFTFTGTEADSIVLISAGVGITPMMSITRYLTERSWAGDIFFVYTCHAPSDFIFADEVAALQRRNPKLHVAVTISKTEGTNWKGASGRISKEWLTQSVPDLASRRIHLCGPPSQMDSIKAILTELGVPPDHLKTEAFGTTKPTPAAPGTTAKPTAPATGPLVTFSKNSKSAKIHADQTILELSEELGIGIEFSCRVGTCGVCKVKMTSGEVEMEVQDALDADDKANGIILACQAKPKDAVAVEA